MEPTSNNENQVDPTITLQTMAALRNSPSLWGETFLSNRDGSPRRYRRYQVDDLECNDTRIVHLDGRSVGKTVNLATLFLWYTYVNKGKSVLIAAPYQGHLNTIIEEVEFQFRNSKTLRGNIASDKGGRPKIRRKPYYDAEFKNGYKGYFRPAGTDGDAFRSLHVDLLLVDEAAWLPEASWQALYQCLNPGGVLRVYSTPNGLRDRKYYKITQSENWTVFRWPSWISPDWSKERREEALDFYTGQNSPGWLHEVAGEHGMPTYGAFDSELVTKAITDISKYRKIDINGNDLIDLTSEEAVRDRLEMMLNLPGGHGRYWMGGDLGYTSSPTELLLLEEDENEIMSLILRVHAERVVYPAISEIIGIIDKLYSPEGIGIDRGGNGMSIEHELTSLNKFRDNNFSGRLQAYDFGGITCIGYDDSGNELRKRTKEHMTNLINKVLNSRKLLLPSSDVEIENQLCTQSYVFKERAVVYSKNEDHIVDALRCAVLRRHSDSNPKGKLQIITEFPKPLVTDPIFW